MSTTPVTQPSLLIRIRDAEDQESWSDFLAIYTPLVYGFLRQRGLQDADAADLTQDVMSRIAGAIKSLDYSPERGSFRRWLFTIVRNRLWNFFREQAARPRGTGDTQTLEMLPQEPAQENGLVDEWDRAYQQQLFHYAADRVRGRFQDSTWQAFWQTAVEGRRAAEVAEDLDLSVPAVLMAKGRVIHRIKEQVDLVQEDEP